MKITTTYTFDAQPEHLWPLLFSSKMDDRHPCFFLYGLPKPLECRLGNQNLEGGVGAQRECVSDKGIIKQNILEWEPQQKLKFELIETDIYFGPYVSSIVETFDICAINATQSTITRNTQLQLKFKYSLCMSIPMSLGLKSIHHYVFKNWERILHQENADVR